MSTKPTPVQDAIDLADRVLADGEAVLSTLIDDAAAAGREGAALSHDAAELAITTLQAAKDTLAQLEAKITALLKGAA